MTPDCVPRIPVASASTSQPQSHSSSPQLRYSPLAFEHPALPAAASHRVSSPSTSFDCSLPTVFENEVLECSCYSSEGLPMTKAQVIQRSPKSSKNMPIVDFFPSKQQSLPPLKQKKFFCRSPSPPPPERMPAELTKRTSSLCHRPSSLFVIDENVEPV